MNGDKVKLFQRISSSQDSDSFTDYESLGCSLFYDIKYNEFHRNLFETIRFKVNSKLIKSRIININNVELSKSQTSKLKDKNN